MVLFVIAALLLLVGLGVLVRGIGARDSDVNFRLVGGILTAVGVVGLLLGSFYFQGLGETITKRNVFTGNISTDIDSGLGVKAPWENTTSWDLFTREITYAGDKDKTTYENGEIESQVKVASVKGGAQASFNLKATYNLDPNAVLGLFDTYRNQERFTKQVVEPKINTAVNNVTVKYTAVEFRGEKREAAATEILESANTALKQYGITVTLVSLQDVNYSDDVETSIKSVEAALQQKAQAEAVADAKIAEATGQAEANRILTESWSAEIAEARTIEAMKIAAEKGNTFYVPWGTQVVAPATNK